MTCERRTPGKITLVFSFRKSFHALKPVLKPPEHFRECRILHILKREPMWFERSVSPHVVRNHICLIARCVICRIVESVSYTHLRAHETDSYLVCRLLLETK